MREQITEMVEAFWARRRPALMQFVAQRTRQIENLLVLEDYYRTGRKGETLKKAMGGFGAEALDLTTLSSVLERGGVSRTMQKERYHRIQTMSQEMEKLGEGFVKSPPACRFLDLREGTDAVVEAFDHHIEPLAKAFRTLRIAEIEARAKYDPALHDTFFENFNWRHLDNSEMALCPPFVVFSEPGENFGEYLAELLRLVTAGKPLKVVMLRSRLDNVVTETGRAAALKSATDVELLFVSLRNLYFFQGSLAGGKPLKEMIAGGLESPRPGIFSIFSPNQNPKEREHRARQALLARAFPHFVYDPDKAADFVSCLDLSDNPASEEVWPTVELEYLNEAGEPEKLERPLTFADFAAGEKALREHFTPLALNGDEGAALPLAEYLALTPERRRDKTPFICSVDEQKHLVQLVPSQSIVAQTADKMHLWHTLQELAGIKNPYVQAAEQRTAERLTAEKERLLSEQKAQLEAQMGAREKEAVAAAMKTLAMRLTGLAPFPSAGQEAPAAALSAEAAAPGVEPAVEPAAAGEVAGPPPQLVEEPAGEVSAEPWIEIQLCTTCDECIAINKKIFAYNAEKKAILKDPRGGPYRDIVKSAEKCSSGAIHPGLPLDPNEKDAEKWIKRAEPFQ